jgi:hypothetical protein
MDKKIEEAQQEFNTILHYIVQGAGLLPEQPG